MYLLVIIALHMLNISIVKFPWVGKDIRWNLTWVG